MLPAGARLAVRAGVAKFSHEMLVELFRTRSELAPRLLQRYAGIDLAHARAEHGSIDLSQVVPTQYSADAVSILRDAENSITSAVISEV